MKLSLRARLGITKFISLQKGNMLDSEIWADIRAVVQVPKEVFDTVCKPIGNDQFMIDKDLLDAEGTEDLNIEKAGRRRLLEGLKSYQGYEPDDSVWNRKVVTALEESLIDAPVEVSKFRKKG